MPRVPPFHSKLLLLLARDQAIDGVEGDIKRRIMRPRSPLEDIHQGILSLGKQEAEVVHPFTTLEESRHG